MRVAHYLEDITSTTILHLPAFFVEKTLEKDRITGQPFALWAREKVCFQPGIAGVITTGAST